MMVDDDGDDDDDDVNLLRYASALTYLFAVWCRCLARWR